MQPNHSLNVGIASAAGRDWSGVRGRASGARGAPVPASDGVRLTKWGVGPNKASHLTGQTLAVSNSSRSPGPQVNSGVRRRRFALAEQRRYRLPLLLGDLTLRRLREEDAVDVLAYRSDP